MGNQYFFDSLVTECMEFKEKPTAKVAQSYIEQGALWNAGVFAFKLGYLIKKAHSLIEFKDYKDLLAKYETLSKISFDYAVVEKESSIQVMRYSGDWKDVGTWNMMSEVMSDVAGASTDNGANVQQYSYNGTLAQKWVVRNNGDGTYSFVNAGNGKCLDITSGRIVSGANLQQYTDNGSLAQKFRLKMK